MYVCCACVGCASMDGVLHVHYVHIYSHVYYVHMSTMFTCTLCSHVRYVHMYTPFTCTHSLRVCLHVCTPFANGRMFCIACQTKTFCCQTCKV